MEDKSIKLTREELYKKVWSKPTSTLAKELGISDVALGKICKKLYVPKPNRGYWRQLEVGHHIQPQPLLKAPKGVPNEVWIEPTPSPSPLQPQNPEVSAKIESEKLSANRIVVAK